MSVLQVDLVAQHHEGEVLGVTRAGLDQELVPPAVEGLEGVGGRDVEHQHTAVRPTVERHAQRLEPLLARRVPDLDQSQERRNDVRTNHGLLSLRWGGVLQ